MENIFDFYFYNHYYFDDLYQKESKLFMNIPKCESIKDYNKDLDKVIEEEKKTSLIKIKSIYL